MKRKKWFVLAALVGLLLSASFLVASCNFNEISACYDVLAKCGIK